VKALGMGRLYNDRVREVRAVFDSGATASLLMRD
jgi:hypothetical protein